MAGGLFDDIPTVNQAPPAAVPGGVPGGLFGDIGPDPLKQVDFIGQDAKAAKEIIAKLPSETQERARDVWADSVVARERAAGGTMQRVDDSVRRVVGAVPGLGTWSDEIAARANSLLGGPDYDMGVALERARTRAIEATPTTKLGTLPVIGDVTTGGLEKAAGVVGGAVALPFARVMEGAGLVPTAVNVAANAGATGFVQGAGEGTDATSRLAKGVTAGATDAGAGLVLGGAIGKFAGKGSPEYLRNLTDSNDTARAAQAVGVDLPRLAAGTKNSAEMQVGAVIKELPLAGRPIQRAVDTARDQIEEAGQRIADSVSPNATPDSAGVMLGHSISRWIQRGSVQENDQAFQAVNALLPRGATADMSNTRNAATRLLNLDREAATDINARAVAFVEDAISRSNGLSFDGMTRLRTRIGDLINDNLTPDGGSIKPALRELYGAISEDIRGGLRTMGRANGNSQAAVNAWQAANNRAFMIQQRRDSLARIVGASGDAPAEMIVDRLVRAAGSKSSADIRTLLNAQRVADPATWNELQAASIHRLGRDQSNTFNPLFFMKNYSALSPNGRSALFGRAMGTPTGAPSLRSQLDSLARVTESFKNLEALRNTSGTGRVVFGTMALMGGTVNPAAIPLIALKGIAARTVAEALAKPVAVRAINRQAQAYYNFLESGRGEAAVKLATLTMAKVIADQTKADEKELTNIVRGNLGTMLAPATGAR